MGGTLPLTLLSSLLAGEASGWVKRTKRNMVFIAVAGLLGLTAWALAVTATVMWLAESSGMLMATLAVAGILAATAIVVVAAMVIMERVERRRAQKRSANAALYASVAAVALPAVLKSRPLLLLALAVGGGLMASKLLAPGETESED